TRRSSDLHASAGQFGWKLPFGAIGLLAIALVAMVASTLGDFAFLGFQFLGYLPLVLGGGMAVTITSPRRCSPLERCVVMRMVCRGGDDDRRKASGLRNAL